MSKPALSRAEILSMIDAAGGANDRRTAVRILQLATEIEAQIWYRHKGFSVRLRGPVGKNQRWLTLFVVSTAATAYTNWLDRWAWAEVPERVAVNYLKGVEAAIGQPFVHRPSSFNSAVPLGVVRRSWSGFEAAVREAARRIHRTKAAAPLDEETTADVGALEGMAKEARVMKRTRSRRMRVAALAKADGVCDACQQDYSLVLGGEGRRVLQVHHREQLAADDEPRITLPGDLAVVCANCHALIHADPRNALPVESLRSRWKRFKSRSARDVA